MPTNLNYYITPVIVSIYDSLYIIYMCLQGLFLCFSILIHVNRKYYDSVLILLISPQNNLISLAIQIACYISKLHFIIMYRTDMNMFSFQLVIIGTYLVCCCFFSVYEMAVDTLFLCFCKRWDQIWSHHDHKLRKFLSLCKVIF